MFFNSVVSLLAVFSKAPTITTLDLCPPASPTFAGPRSRKSRAQCGLSNSGLRLNPEANVKVTVAESSVSVIANKDYDVPSPPLVSDCFLIGLNR